MQLPEVGDLGPKYAIQIMVWIIYQVVTRERGAPDLAQDALSVRIAIYLTLGSKDGWENRISSINADPSYTLSINDLNWNLNCLSPLDHFHSVSQWQTDAA